MQKPKKEADLLSRPLTEKSKMGKNGSKNGIKWKNIDISLSHDLSTI
jgi:hypothetical protein